MWTHMRKIELVFLRAWSQLKIYGSGLGGGVGLQENDITGERLLRSVLLT